MGGLLPAGGVLGEVHFHLAFGKVFLYSWDIIVMYVCEIGTMRGL